MYSRPVNQISHGAWDPFVSVRSQIRHLRIEEGVRSVGSAMFTYCTQLESVSLPEGLRYIGMYGFSGCGSLTSVTIPEGTWFLDDYAFSNCVNLAGVALPDSLMRIGSYAFENCRSLSSVAIPDFVNDIDENAFSGCSGLTRVTFSNFVTSIGCSAFSGCSGLTSLTLPDSVTDIGTCAFSGCSGLTRATVSGSVTSIGADAFPASAVIQTACDAIAVRNYAQANGIACALTHDYAGDGVCRRCGFHRGSGAAIVDSGTCGKKNTDSVMWTLDDSGMLSVFGTGEMADCEECGPWGSSVRRAFIGDGVTGIGDYAFNGCGRLRSLSIPDSVTGIGSHAFSGCGSLTSVTIPDGVTSVGAHAFDGCPAMRCAGPDSRAALALSRAGCSFRLPGAKYALIYLFRNGSPAGLELREADGDTVAAVIGEGVVSIGADAFRGCSDLASVSFPEGLANIGEGAFEGCGHLTSVTIPGSVASVGDGAFSHSGVTGICFLGETTSFGSAVFDADALPTVYCREYSDAEAWARLQGYPSRLLDEFSMDAVRELTLPEDFRLAVGASRAIDRFMFPEDASELRWTSSNPEIVSVEDGVATAVSKGTATVTAAAGDASDSVTVTAYVPTASFALNTAEAWVVSKNTVRLAVTEVEPADADPDFTWHSNDPMVATVDDSGLVTANRPGDAVLSAVDGGVRRECLLHVCYPVTAIEFEESGFTMNTGSRRQATANVAMRTQTCVNRLVTFASSDDTVATVSAEGVITATGVGGATVTATAANGISAELAVSVVDCDAVGHAWGEVRYVWSEDNGAVTATRVCAHDATHVETETVETDRAVKAEPTCVREGIETYTPAAFTNPAFETQPPRDVPIPASPELHSWGAAT